MSNPNLGTNFFMDNINFPTSEGKDINVVVKAEKPPLCGKIVPIKSQEFQDFITECKDNARGRCIANNKIPVIYDVCLTCWEFMTYYYLNKHEKRGHKGAKGNTIKTEEDFLCLARASNKISDDGTKVVLFKPYHKQVRSLEILRKHTEELGLRLIEETPVNDLAATKLLNPQTPAIDPVEKENVKKRDKKSAPQFSSLVEEITSLKTEITDFTSRICQKLDKIISKIPKNQENTHDPPLKSPPKLQNTSDITSDPSSIESLIDTIIGGSFKKDTNCDELQDIFTKSETVEYPTKHEEEKDFEDVIKLPPNVRRY